MKRFAALGVLVAAVVVAAPASTSVAVTGNQCFIAYGVSTTVPGAKDCRFDIYLRVREESKDTGYSYTGAYAGSWRNVRLVVSTKPSSFRRGKQTSLNVKPVLPKMQVNGSSVLALDGCPSGKRNIQLRVRLDIGVTAFDRRESGPSIGPFGFFSIAVQPEREVSEGDCQLLPTYTEHRDRVAGPGYIRNFDFGNGYTNVDLGYRRAQDIGKYSFPIDYLAAGKSFDLGFQGKAQSPSGGTTTYELLVKFIRRR
jgi:hypothetical protein